MTDSETSSDDTEQQNLIRYWCKLVGHNWSLVGCLHKHPDKNPHDAWCSRCGKSISDKDLAEYMLDKYSGSDYQIGNASYSSGLSKEYVRGIADCSVSSETDHENSENKS